MKCEFKNTMKKKVFFFEFYEYFRFKMSWLLISTPPCNNIS